MMLSDVSPGEMFPRAHAVMRAPLPTLKLASVHQRINQQATKQGISLDSQHMEVINFVLDFYEHCDDCQNARRLTDMLQEEFAPQGGRKYLYQLFSNSPLSTVHNLADLPSLGHQTDESFGTRW